MATNAREWSIRLVGYSALTAEQIAGHIEAVRPVEVLRRPGSFVAIATRPGSDETYILTSAFGTIPYYYGVVSGRLFHGTTVADVLVDSGLPFRWNLEAVGTLLCLEHLTGTQTLHPEIHRTPPASVLHFRDGAFQVTTHSWGDIQSRVNEDDVSPESVTNLLVEEVDRFAGSNPVLSSSAGFDSRLLLAALLRAGRRPRLLVAGCTTSTDRQITEKMAARLGLETIPIELPPAAFAPAAETISQATNGTKSALHWHTFLYPHLANIEREAALLVGANGEFARSYYLNWGILSRGTALLPARPLAQAFWERKSLLRRNLRPEDYCHLSSNLADALRCTAAAHAERMWALHPAGSLLEHLDQTYLYERVRHFIGNGLALYGLSARPITPFLSSEWVNAVARLPRRWKLGSAYHRRAIQLLKPELLDFYEEGTNGAMTVRPVPFYYHRNKVAPVPLYDRDAVFSDPGFQALLPKYADAVGDLVDPSWFQRLTPQTHQRFIATLLPMAIWASNCRRVISAAAERRSAR